MSIENSSSHMLGRILSHTSCALINAKINGQCNQYVCVWEIVLK